jgi:hypothetical protein
MDLIIQLGWRGAIRPCAVESVTREKGLTEFEKYLLRNKVTSITGRVDHAQTNGKPEKFFDIFEKNVELFP